MNSVPFQGHTVDAILIKEVSGMANLTSKELSALEDQLGFEKVLCCKYQAAEQE